MTDEEAWAEVNSVCESAILDGAKPEWLDQGWREIMFRLVKHPENIEQHIRDAMNYGLPHS